MSAARGEAGDEHRTAGVKRIVIVPYDPAWPELFERERSRLEEAFAGTDVAIEHVGSTAVPGLGAKPVIDIMAGVSAPSVADERIEALAELGYQYVPEYQRELPERRYFRRPVERPRTHHLHCVVMDGPFWRRHIAFRDRLRADPGVARAYATLKMELAERHPADGAAYTEAKSPFIEGVLAMGGAG